MSACQLNGESPQSFVQLRRWLQSQIGPSQGTGRRVRDIPGRQNDLYIRIHPGEEVRQKLHDEMPLLVCLVQPVE